MFNKDFYPTPFEVIEKMCFGFDFSNSNILEPSAGKGDILNYISERFTTAKLYFCEINFELQKMCKNAKFLGNDFLQLKSSDVSHIDYFVMNPPFSGDDTHILHAYNIAKDGSVIISLCNSNTLNKSHYKNSKNIRKIIELYGFSKDLGNVFTHAERKTDVYVSLVIINKPIVETEDFFNLNEFETNDFEEFGQKEGIKTYNYIEDMVNRYIGTVKLFEKQAELATQINDLIKPTGIYAHKLMFSVKAEDKDTTVQEVCADLRIKFWEVIFSKLNLNKFETSSLKEDINYFFRTQKQVPFTMKNIYKMIEIVLGTHEGRMNKALVTAADYIVDLSAENRHSWKNEKWKTNIPDGIGKKFIIDHACGKDSNGGFNVAYGETIDMFNDFNKSIHYINGFDLKDVKPLRYLNEFNKKWGEWIYFGFFEVKFFKKGTMHVKFNSDKTWEMVNRKIAEIKGYPLPENLSTK